MIWSPLVFETIAAFQCRLGGPFPLGYHMKDDKIAVVEDEAKRVRLIFHRYLELGGVNALVRDLRERDIRTKSRLLATRATRGGVPFGRGSLFYLLRNRFYVGEPCAQDAMPETGDGLLARGDGKTLRHRAVSESG